MLKHLFQTFLGLASILTLVSKLGSAKVILYTTPTYTMGTECGIAKFKFSGGKERPHPVTECVLSFFFDISISQTRMELK